MTPHLATFPSTLPLHEPPPAHFPPPPFSPYASLKLAPGTPGPHCNSPLALPPPPYHALVQQLNCAYASAVADSCELTVAVQLVRVLAQGGLSAVLPSAPPSRPHTFIRPVQHLSPIQPRLARQARPAGAVPGSDVCCCVGAPSARSTLVVSDPARGAQPVVVQPRSHARTEGD